MIRRTLLGTILVSMVASPLCAVAKRPGVMAAGVVNRLVKAKPQSLQSMYKGARSVSNQAPKVAQGIDRTALVVAARQQQSQGNDGSWFKSKSLLQGLTGLGASLGLMSTAQAEEAELPTLEEFNQLNEEQQLDLIGKILGKNKSLWLVKIFGKNELSWNDKRFLSRVFNNSSSEIKNLIISSVDFSDIRKLGVNITYKAFISLDEVKQQEILSKLLNNNELFRPAIEFLDLVFYDGSEEIKNIIVQQMIAQHIDFSNIEMLGFSLPSKAFKSLSEKERQDALGKFFSKNKLSQNDIWFLEEIFDDSSEEIKHMVAQHIDFIDIQLCGAYFSLKVFAYLSEEKQKEALVRVLGKDELSDNEWFLREVFYNGSEEIKQLIVQKITRHIDFTNIERFGYEIAFDVFKGLPEEEQQEALAKILGKGELSDDDRCLLEGIFDNGSEEIKQLIAQEIAQQIDFTNIERLGYKLASEVFAYLLEEEQKEALVKILGKGELSDDDRKFLERIYEKGTDQIKDMMFNKSPVSEIFSSPDTKKTPTYTCSRQHLDRNTLYCSLPKPLKELVKKMVEYQAQEMKQGQVVIFNGQQSRRSLYEDLARKMYEWKHGVTVDDDGTMVRYFEADTISEEERLKLCKKGTTNIRKERKNLVFGNIDALGNASLRGSCTIEYIKDDEDMSHGNLDTVIQEIFTHYGLKNEYKQLVEQQPEMLEKIYEVHDKISKYGTLISFSIPKEEEGNLYAEAAYYGLFFNDKQSVNDFVYPSRSGGYLTEYAGMEQVTDILNNMGEMPSDHEYCIPTGIEMANPLLAKERNIKIKKWFVEPDLKAMAERDALLDDMITKCVAMKDAKG